MSLVKVDTTHTKGLAVLLAVSVIVLLGGVGIYAVSENAVAESSPTAEFEVTPSDPGPDEEFELDASLSEAPAGEITSYDWNIDRYYYEWSGDSGAGKTVTGSYDSYGEYEIELEVTDNGGATDTITKTVTVDEEGPTAEFEVTPSDPGPDEEFELDASLSEAPAGEITSYDWNIDRYYYEWSGDSGAGKTVTGAYEGIEEYEIELEVTDNGGATDSITKTIDVGGDGPIAEFDFSSSSPAPNEEIVFDASGSEITAGDAVTYDWSYETADGGDGSSSGESPTHSFGNYGEYSVELTVIDEFDRSDSVTKNVSVSGEGPTAEFEYSPSDPDLDERVVFDGSVSTEPDLTIEEYRWFVNGRQQGSGSEADMVFNDAGVYNIELEVENTGGKTDRVDEHIRVGDEAAIIDNPDFELARSSPESKSVDVNPGETLSFISELDSKEVPEATKVLYVTGEFVNRSNVGSKTLRTTHQFQEIGEHTIEVEVEGAAGKSDVVQWDVTVHEFASLPTISDQSSSEAVSVEGGTEILTFSIQNPEVNERQIHAEIVAELPDGISISAASGVSTGDAAVQVSTKTVAPGHQESMRLDINVDDESLNGQQVTIPYQIRYRPVGDENITYTPDEQELEVTVGSPQDSDEAISDDGEVIEDQSGFGIMATLTALLIVALVTIRRTNFENI